MPAPAASLAAAVAEPGQQLLAIAAGTLPSAARPGPCRRSRPLVLAAGPGQAGLPQPARLLPMLSVFAAAYRAGEGAAASLGAEREGAETASARHGVSTVPPSAAVSSSPAR